MLQSARILDLTWVLGGPFGGQLLAQLGAEVIKVEPADGDPAREIPPHYVGDLSSFFLSVNRGKKSIALDLKTDAGLTAFYDLVPPVRCGSLRVRPRCSPATRHRLRAAPRNQSRDRRGRAHRDP